MSTEALREKVVGHYALKAEAATELARLTAETETEKARRASYRRPEWLRLVKDDAGNREYVTDDGYRAFAFDLNDSGRMHTMYEVTAPDSAKDTVERVEEIERWITEHRASVTVPPVFEHLPLTRVSAVHHVGTLEVADRKKQSYEGEGLAVSLDPDDWARIAKLPGQTWTLRRRDGESLRFVSFRDMRPEEVQKVRAWGQRNGWCEPRTVYRVHWYDDELDQQVWMECDTKAEALEEQEARDPDELIAETIAWRPTEAFPDKRITSDCDPSDVLLAHYIREHRPDYDGVWWDDEYTPDALSCPRGVIVHPLDRYDIAPRD